MTFRIPDGSPEKVKIDAAVSTVDGNGDSEMQQQHHPWEQGEEPPKVSFSFPAYEYSIGFLISCVKDAQNYTQCPATEVDASGRRSSFLRLYVVSLKRIALSLALQNTACGGFLCLQWTTRSWSTLASATGNWNNGAIDCGRTKGQGCQQCILDAHCRGRKGGSSCVSSSQCCSSSECFTVAFRAILQTHQS